MALNTNHSGNARNGQQFYESHGTDSHGNPGTWHIYEDSHGNVTNSIFIADPKPVVAAGQPNSIADSAAAALTPAAAPATTTVVSTASSAGTNHADGLHNVPTGFSGNASEVHSSSPAEAITPSDAMQPNPTTVAPGWNASTQPTADNLTGGTLALDSTELVVSHAASLPAEDTSAQSAGVVAPATTTSIDNGLTTVGNDQFYSVAQGDSMWDIAQKHNMSFEQLQALNPQIQNPQLILPGQQINIGGAAAAEGATTFPTTSTYDQTTVIAQTPETQNNLAHGLGGWSDGTSSVPNDPTHGVVAAAPVQTDPLKIDH